MLHTYYVPQSHARDHKKQNENAPTLKYYQLTVYEEITSKTEVIVYCFGTSHVPEIQRKDPMGKVPGILPTLEFDFKNICAMRGGGKRHAKLYFIYSITLP